MTRRLDTSSIRKLATSLKTKPIAAQQRIATRAAPVLTAMAGSSYDGGQTAYGEARPAGVEGALDLVVTGRTRSTVVFKAIGTIVRAVLGTKYARYLIGKYGILPNANAAIPAAWQAKLQTIAQEELAAYYADELGGQA